MIVWSNFARGQWLRSAIHEVAGVKDGCKTLVQVWGTAHPRVLDQLVGTYRGAVSSDLLERLQDLGRRAQSHTYAGIDDAGSERLQHRRYDFAPDDAPLRRDLAHELSCALGGPVRVTEGGVIFVDSTNDPTAWRHHDAADISDDDRLLPGDELDHRQLTAVVVLRKPRRGGSIFFPFMN